MDNSIKAVRSGKRLYIISSTGYLEWKVEDKTELSLYDNIGNNWDNLIAFTQAYCKEKNMRIAAI